MKLSNESPATHIHPDAFAHFLRSVPLFRELASADARRLVQKVVMAKYLKGEMIYREGARAENAFIVQSGAVKLSVYSTSGRILALELAVRHDIFGGICPNNVAVYPTAAFAVADSALCQIPVGELYRLDLEYKTVQDGLFAKVCQDLHRSHSWRGLALENADRRIVHSLLYLQRRLGNVIPQTRATIAEFSGTTVETAIRVIHKLANLEILAADRGAITITSPEGLERMLR
jgi:CRP/FNR family transcriptional regulator